MRVITGEIFNTSFGKILVHNEQDEIISVGEKVSCDNKLYTVMKIMPPTKFDGKWSLVVQ